MKLGLNFEGQPEGPGGGRKVGMVGRVGVGDTGVLGICSAHMWNRKLCLKSHAGHLSSEVHSAATQGILAMLGRPKCLAA